MLPVARPVNVDADGVHGEPVEDGGGESRKCPLAVGPHSLTGDKRFGIMAYGYGSAGSYAFAGGADVRKIYVPPVPQ